MDTNNVSIAMQLTQARDSLSPENWRKGRYFQLGGGGQLCMCAHGAVQNVVNPQCRRAFKNQDKRLPAQIVEARNAAFVSVLYINPQLSILQQWQDRPNFVKEDRIADGKNYGNEEANYLLSLVGLTTGYNDYPATTYNMVIEKFNQAIAFAQEWGI